MWHRAVRADRKTNLDHSLSLPELSAPHGRTDGHARGMKKDHVRFTQGERAIFESSPGVGRGFCSQCGTPLTWEGDGEELGPLVEIHIGTLDDPSAFVPESHLHHDERIPWFEVADELPRHHEWDEGKPYRHGPV